MKTDEIMALADEWYSYGQTSHSGINEKYDALRAAVEQIVRDRDEAQAELEQERVRLAACGVAAMSNTRDSLAKVRADCPQGCYGWSASFDDCCRASEREINERERAERAERERDAAIALLKEARPMVMDAADFEVVNWHNAVDLLARIDAYTTGTSTSVCESSEKMNRTGD